MTHPVDVSIVTSGHDVADARLHREVAAFRRAGLTVEVWGLGLPDAGPSQAKVVARPRGSLIGRARAALVLPWRARGRVLVSLDPDSAVGCAIKRLVLGPRRMRWVADVHEDYLKLLEDRTWARGLAGLAGRSLARLGNWVAKRADLTVVVDSYLLETAPRRLVARNTPDVAMLPPQGPPDAAPRALYVGDLRPSRGLMPILQMAAKAPDWSFDLVGPVRPSDQGQVDAFLEAHPLVGERVHFHGRKPPVEGWALAQGAWVGLSMLENTSAFRETMPSKIYEYLACGLPVLTTPLPRPAELIKQTGAGAVVENADQGAAVLRSWSSQPEEYAKAAQAAVQAGQQVRQDSTDMARLASAVKDLVKRPWAQSL